MTTVERFKALEHKLGSKIIDKEFVYFTKYARSFEKTEPDPNKKYGILIMGAEPSENNMVYSSDVLLLRLAHLEALADRRGLSVGH